MKESPLNKSEHYDGRFADHSVAHGYLLEFNDNCRKNFASWTLQGLHAYEIDGIVKCKAVVTAAGNIPSKDEFLWDKSSRRMVVTRETIRGDNGLLEEGENFYYKKSISYATTISDGAYIRVSLIRDQKGGGLVPSLPYLKHKG
tara:strand:- start:151 stop:582 length:432 start_codon:yes stop_codon:yes gene_type:complete